MDKTLQLKIVAKPLIDPDSGEFKVQIRVDLPMRGNGLQKLHPALINQEMVFAGEALNYAWGNIDFAVKTRFRTYFLEDLLPEEIPVVIKTEVEKLSNQFKEVVQDFKSRASRLPSPSEYTVEVEL